MQSISGTGQYLTFTLRSPSGQTVLRTGAYFGITRHRRLSAGHARERGTYSLVVDGAGDDMATYEFLLSSQEAGWTYLWVNSTADPGDGVCDAAECTLREAIDAANLATGPAMIRFDIPVTDAGHVYYRNDGIAGSLSIVATTQLPDDRITDFDPDYPLEPFSWYTHPVASPLPDITNSVVIDGYSQSGASQNTHALEDGLNTVLRVELDGRLAGSAPGPASAGRRQPVARAGDQPLRFGRDTPGKRTTTMSSKGALSART